MVFDSFKTKRQNFILSLTRGQKIVITLNFTSTTTTILAPWTNSTWKMSEQGTGRLNQEKKIELSYRVSQKYKLTFPFFQFIVVSFTMGIDEDCNGNRSSQN